MPLGNAQRGFTLLETIMFIVIVSLAAAGIAMMFSEGIRSSAEPFMQQRALAVGNAYMDEILHKRWDENTPIGGGCVETGTLYCTNLCAALPFPDCGSCQLGAGVCLPAAAASGALGPDGEVRPDFDDVDDYGNLTASPPTDSTGAAMPGYAGFTVAVQVAPPAGGWNGIPAADVKRIDVTVTVGTTSQSLDLRGYRVNY